MQLTSAEAKDGLLDVIWENGKVVPVCEGPYRFQVVIQCSQKGRQKAMFSNGEFPYFAYVRLLSGDGTWIEQGAGVVPVLKDGRFLMVVEQRPAQGYGNPSIARIGGKNVDLSQFGEFSSLEFPGGAVDPGEGLKAGFLRELVEETGVGEQIAMHYARCNPIYPQGADLALKQYIGVIFLSGLSFLDKVSTDGGLNVFALTKDELVHNILAGVIRSNQAALTQWAFYKEVEEAIASPHLLQTMIDAKYLSVEEVKVQLPK